MHTFCGGQFLENHAQLYEALFKPSYAPEYMHITHPSLGRILTVEVKMTIKGYC